MKKLIPLLVIAAGAVAYNVYKTRKEPLNDEKTLVHVDDSTDDSNHVESKLAQEPVVEDSIIEEVVTIVKEDVIENSEPVEDVVEEPVVEEKKAEEDTISEEEYTEEPEQNEDSNEQITVEETVDEIAEVMQELQEELGTFETLNEAIKVYNKAKKKRFLQHIEKYKDQLEPRVLDALLKFSEKTFG